MAMRRPRRPREQWVEIVRGFGSSGLTQPEYAQRCGVGLSSFRYWVHKLSHEVQDAALATTPRVEFVEVFSEAGAHRRDGGRLTLRVNDLAMEFEATPSPAWLVELVRGLTRRASC